jgi:hypothetical protein
MSFPLVGNLSEEKKDSGQARMTAKLEGLLTDPRQGVDKSRNDRNHQKDVVILMVLLVNLKN